MAAVRGKAWVQMSRQRRATDPGFLFSVMALWCPGTTRKVMEKQNKQKRKQGSTMPLAADVVSLLSFSNPLSACLRAREAQPTGGDTHLQRKLLCSCLLSQAYQVSLVHLFNIYINIIYIYCIGFLCLYGQQVERETCRR